MMKAGIETGSLMNHVYSGCDNPAPAVGMGATVLGWTDRHAGTIIAVTPKSITVQEDKATRTDCNGMSDSQTYDYEPNPEGMIRVFRLGKKGWREKGGGNGLLIGCRKKYHDFSF